MRRYLALPVSVAGAAVLAVALPARAEPPAISAKRAEAQRVLAELRVFDDRFERTVEAYDLVRIKLAENARALSTNGHRLRVARRNLTSAQRRIAARLVYLYTTSEPTSSLDVILGARSLGDFLDRLEAARRIADEDSLVVNEVRTFKVSVDRQRRLLNRQRREQTQLAAELASQRSAIQAQLEERRGLLSSIKGEIVRLEAKERARQEELRRQAEARIEAARLARQAQSGSDPDLGASAVTPEGIGVAPDTRHAHVVPIAMRYLGVPYLWGGASPETGFDCSGFVLYVYAQVGVSLPHNAAMQYQYGVPVAKEDLQPGDIVFFNDLGHDGIYIGGGQFIQAPRTGDVVKISSLSEPWYAATYVGARRLP